MSFELKAHASIIFDPTMPGNPSLAAVTPGDTELVLAVIANDASDVIYARWATLTGAWSSESETFKRVGSGNITLTGLTNGTKYWVAIYTRSDDYTSDWDFGYGTPTDGTNAATGMLSLPLEYLRHSIAGSGTFQAETGSANEDAALAYVHTLSTADMTKPFVIVDWPDNFKRSIYAGGTHDFFSSDSELWVLFRWAIEDSNDGIAARIFLNKLGAIMKEIENRSGTSGYLAMAPGWQFAQKPRRPDEDEIKSSKDAADELIGDFYEVIISVSFEDPL